MMTEGVQQTENIDKAKLMRWAGYASVFTAAVIIVLKLGAWFYTDSLSLLSSLVDSLLDILVSIINLVAINYALRPADEEHRFGHGKAEDIAGMFQAAFIAGSALLISIQALGRFFSPHPVQHTMIGIYVMLIATVLTLALVVFQRYVVRKTGSTVVTADSLHYITDIAINMIVMISLGLSYRSGWQWLDPLFGIVIAVYILRAGWRVGVVAFDRLMDHELDEKERRKLIEAVLSHPEVMGLHDLRTRRSGITPIIQFHLELDGDMTLSNAHHISDEVESFILKDYPDAEITIHQDPDDHEEIPLTKEGIKAVRHKPKKSI